jgi:hypothetical protein
MARSSEVEITYTPRLGISAEDEISALASVYSFVLRAHQQRNQGKEGGPPTAPNEGERSLDEFASTKNLTKRAGRAWPSA